MNRQKVLWTAWAMIPVVLAIWWFGPGQELQARSRVASTVELAMAAADQENWQEAAELFGQAIGEAPTDSPESNRWLRLHASHAEFMSGNTWNGISGMEEVLDEIKDADPVLARDARARIASSTSQPGNFASKAPTLQCGNLKLRRLVNTSVCSPKMPRLVVPANRKTSRRMSSR